MKYIWKKPFLFLNKLFSNGSADTSYRKEREELLRQSYFRTINIHEKYGNFNLPFTLPVAAKLKRIFEWRKGDLPDDEQLVQWMLFLEFVYLHQVNELTCSNDFAELWKCTPLFTKKMLCRWYIHTVHPMCRYTWKKELPVDDPEVFESVENADGPLVVLYPYVFFRRDVPFLFDTSMDMPGCGKESAFEVDVSKSLAFYTLADQVDINRFSRAIDNSVSNNPVFIKDGNVFTIELPDEPKARKDFSTKEVLSMESSDFMMSLHPDAIRKIVELNKRQHQESVENVDFIQKANVTTESADNNPKITIANTDASILCKENISDSDEISAQKRGNTNSSASESFIGKELLNVDRRDNEYTTGHYFDDSVKDDTGIELLSDFEEIKNALPDTKSFLPSTLPPIDGARVFMGSGVTHRLLGRGGEGCVYQIWVDELECFRALKLMVPNVDTIEDYERKKRRFHREVKLNANLHHTGIAQIYTNGEWEKYLFIEMEYVNGLDLKKLIEQYGKLSPAVAMAAFIHIIRALRHAHNKSYIVDGRTYKGLIHRDMKPANVMLSNEGETKILDFGIAKPFGMSTKTCTNGFIGTLNYSSPEHINGQELDFRSDIYSAGLILQEMLTGLPVINNKHTVKEMLNNIVAGKFKAVDEYNVKIPKSLRYIIRRCLETNPSKRFDSTNALFSVCMEALDDLSREYPEAILQQYVEDAGLAGNDR
jgi:predicted Ser/Thr protein kinase